MAICGPRNQRDVVRAVVGCRLWQPVFLLCVCAPEFMTDSEAYAEPDKSRKVDPPPGVEGGVVVMEGPATEEVEAITPSSCW